MILIGLIAWIGKEAYKKINKIIDMMNSMLVNHQKHDSDIEQLKKDQTDHEIRIRTLENEKQNNY